MGQLRLALLGPPRVEVGGAVLRVDTRKAVALLAYLACGGGRHARDGIAALLWPDADDAHARAALRRTLSALNHALGDGARVAADRTGLELAAPGMDLDVRRFRELVAACGAHGHEPERACPACADPLAGAVALHRGDFMAGFALRDAPEFESWQLAEADTLRREQAGALQRLVDAYTVQGRWQAAIAQAERWLALDPLHEPAHRQLMRLYAWSDQRGAAMRQYRSCVRVLDQELGVPPLEETTALYQAVTEGHVEPPRVAPAGTTTAAAVPAAADAPDTAGTPGATDGPADGPAPPPLVGRSAQWAALADAWAGIERQGRGRLVALTGEPGIGKTRLAEDFVAHVSASHGQVLACRCYEGERLAYGPLADGLRAALARPAGAPGARWANDLDQHWLAEAARLLPELAPLVSSTSTLAPPDGPGAQSRFLEGLCRTLLAAAKGARPGLLVLDDLHWADEATLDAVGYMVHRLDRLPLLVLAAWRGEHVPRGHRLRRIVAEAQRGGTARVLALARLDRDSVAALVRAVAPSRTAVIEELHQRTEGLPLLLVEYLAALDGDGPLPALPSGARELLQARLERVSETAWQVLTAAAVIGRSFDVDTVREASGRSDDEATGALEELVRLGLIHEVTGPVTWYDFGHEQVRVLVYEQAGLARRRLLHRRVAQALAGHAPSQDTAVAAASIARHFQLAGRDGTAAEWFARAGERAAALYANREAVVHYAAALALGHPDTVRLQVAVGDLHTLLGDYGAALTAYEAAAARCEPGDLAAVEHKLGSLHHRRGDWEAAEAHLEAALAALGDDPGSVAATATRARLVADRSLVAHRRGRAEQAGELAAQALALAERAAEPAALAQCHNLVGVLATSAGDHRRARGHLERSLAIAETLPDLGVRVAALNNLALAHRAAGRPQAALELTTAALDLCVAQGDRHREAALRNNLADLYHSAGRHDEAMTHLKQAVAIFAEVGEPDRLQPAIWQLVEW